MQAIKTRYLPATNTLGARIVAESCGGKVTVNRTCCEVEEDEERAVQTLIDKLGWPYSTDTMLHGGGVNGETYWVFR